MRPAAVLFLSLLLLWTLLAEVNHALAGFHVFLFAGGLFVTYAALALPLSAGLAATLLGGFLCDANAPVAFGTHALLFAVAHLLIFNARGRLPRHETTGRVLIAVAANLGLFLTLSLIAFGRNRGPAGAWLRLISDLACSQVFLALAAPWFFALQERALVLAGSLPERRHR